MPVKNGDFIKLEYTGKVQETGDVFDSTSEEVAEENGIHSDKKTYGPVSVIIGGGHVLKGMEEALVDMEEGEEKTIELTPEEAFGERDPKLIQLVPMSEFKKQGIKPQVGMAITSEGNTGIIRSVSGGRVRLDFNHELAGKNLEYQVKVVGIIEDDAEKVKSLIELHYRTPNLDSEKHQVDIEEDKIVITMDEMAKFDQRPHMEVTMDRFRISRDIQDNMGIKTVEFVDSFVKKEEVEESTEEVSVDEVSTEDVPEKLPEEEKQD
ncbi:MAG: FKBP-type peptidyl-prolyl cis-trans isomerase [Euryarchaeota archaeon]|jgi:FKBP-type peptidyl-prolyl cis-trans isomerase SlyD|uniref:peptidylprolyl isomerase n=1 Tax=Methanobacterium sp. MZD130B TaxID=3394378 RepID=UPI00177A003D|nr:FKBP-type peptidyl-prolyl cis-trans isomerase [Euryarchaeota archaeon]HHT18403.1 peptidylprolyl isomerase [Methanobacterium sp.]